MEWISVYEFLPGLSYANDRKFIVKVVGKNKIKQVNGDHYYVDECVHYIESNFDFREGTGSFKFSLEEKYDKTEITHWMIP